MQKRLFDEPEAISYFVHNKNTAKSMFVNLALLLLDGAIDLDQSLDGVGEPLQSIQSRMPYPENPRRGNGLNECTCSRCGRTGVILKLNLRAGWLCLRCNREYMVAMGWEDEYGRLLPDCESCNGINQSTCPARCREAEFKRHDEFFGYTGI